MIRVDGFYDVRVGEKTLVYGNYMRYNIVNEKMLKHLWEI